MFPGSLCSRTLAFPFPFPRVGLLLLLFLFPFFPFLPLLPAKILMFLSSRRFGSVVVPDSCRPMLLALRTVVVLLAIEPSATLDAPPWVTLFRGHDVLHKGEVARMVVEKPPGNLGNLQL